MRISEIFYSIQGEGALSGIPSTFIRTTGCNLRCTWCDTPYTSWEPTGQEMSVEALLGSVEEFGSHHVVVTGGEPMIAPGVVALTHALKKRNIHITVETAGTRYQPVACDLMSISPKLSNSTPRDREDGRWERVHDATRMRLPILQQLVAEFDYQLKFVLTSPEDLPEIESLANFLKAVPDKVLLMPEGRSSAELASKALWIVEICKKTGYRYCPRLHVDLWGDKRGV